MIPSHRRAFSPIFQTGGGTISSSIATCRRCTGHWNDPANNPVSPVYGGRMVDMARAFVWAWDARPWPDFPVRLTTWVDGENYERGHWLNGRASLAALAEVVAEISRRGGLAGIDVAKLHGSVVGYTISAVETGRQSLQPLMLAHAFDSRAEGEVLAFHSRGGPVVAEIGADDCVLAGSDGVLRRSRAPLLDAPGRVGLEFARADADYAVGAVAAVSPEEAETHAAQSSLPIVMSEATARGIVERWLAEGRVARETMALALPPSRLAIAPGDVDRCHLRGSRGSGARGQDRGPRAPRHRGRADRAGPLRGAGLSRGAAAGSGDRGAGAGACGVPGPAAVERGRGAACTARGGGRAAMAGVGGGLCGERGLRLCVQHRGRAAGGDGRDAGAAGGRAGGSCG